MKVKELFKSLEAKIQNSYEQGVTLEEAERLAAEFLHAQLLVSGELSKADLNARMRKSGTKTIKAAIYLDIVSKADKKPTEAMIQAQIDSDKLVSAEQSDLDSAEVNKAELDRYYDIFLNAHIYYRGISKKGFE